MKGIDAHAIHARLGPDGWRGVLTDAGFTEKQLSKRNGPCPVCAGTDRYHFSNKYGRGDAYCRQCGHLDGFKLLMGARGISFSEARKLVMHLAGIAVDADSISVRPVMREQAALEIAEPTPRVRNLIRESCAIEDCEAARLYLAGRRLWPLPAGHSLRAHPSVPYWQERQKIGVFPALIAAVRDIDGDLVTAHVTYLEPTGEKLHGFDARKILSGLSGREGCAVPLMPHGDVLGIAEGIETAFSASIMHEVPVWAALNTSLLQKFEPPHTVNKLIIFADHDVAGLDAATKLMERLQERVRLVIKTPHLKDFNDVLRAVA